jgi:hypothetical protein
LKPLESVLLGDLLTSSNATLLSLLEGNTATRTTQDNKDIHTINTNARVVLNSKINVLINTETEVSGVVEVAFLFNK